MRRNAVLVRLGTSSRPEASMKLYRMKIPDVFQLDKDARPKSPQPRGLVLIAGNSLIGVGFVSYIVFETL